MSEFDAFESAGQPQEEDPAADFLAREQDQLAGLDDDEFSGVPAPGANDAALQGMMEELDANPEVLQEFDNMLGDFEDTTPAAAPGGDGFTLGDIGGETSTDDFDPMAMQDPGMQQHEMPSDPYNEISRVDKQRQEPEKIRVWREEQAVMLEEKDKASDAKKEEWRGVAKQELEDWYKHRAETLEKSKKSNREGEEEFLKDRDEVTPGHEWERICRNCEFNPKGNRNQKDISRMRSILLQLKQSPLVR